MKAVLLTVNSEGNGIVGKKGSLLVGEACGIECEDESKPHGTAKLIRPLSSRVM
jgi:hypothetical protein